MGLGKRCTDGETWEHAHSALLAGHTHEVVSDLGDSSSLRDPSDGYLHVKSLDDGPALGRHQGIGDNGCS